MTAAPAPKTAPTPTIDTDYATALLAEHGVTVAGRTFAISQRLTFRQTAYVQKWRRAARLDEMLAHFTPTSDEKVSAFIEDLIVESFENDAIFHLLAGGMVEVRNGQPVRWTKDGAERLADFFAELSDLADQQALQKAILGVLASFFLARIVGALASPSSSASSADMEETPRSDTAAAPDPSPSPPIQRSPRQSEPPAETAGLAMATADLGDRILASTPPPERRVPDEAAPTSAHSTS